MKNIHYLKTNNGNHYLYNYSKKQILFIHPIIINLFLLWKENNKKLTLNKVLSGDLKFEKSDISYYYKKFNFLLNNGFFNNKEIKNKVQYNIDKNTIDYQLANVPQVTFEVTERCNLDCTYCGYGKFYWDHDNREQKDLNIKAAKNLLEYLKTKWDTPLNNYHGKYITISFYGGEPLLNFPFIKSIVSLIESFKMKHLKFRFSMTTNGILIPKYINYLIEHDFYMLISLDGNKVNNVYRKFKNKKLSYNKVIDSINLIRKKDPEYFDKNINFNSVLHKQNNIEDIVHFFENEFNKNPRVSQLNNVGIRKEKLNEFKKMFKLKNEDLEKSTDIEKLKKKLGINSPQVLENTIFLHKYFDNTFKSFNDLIYSKPKKELKTIPTGTCLPFAKKIFVTANGKLLPCERIGHQYDLGKTTNEGVKINISQISRKVSLFYKSIKNQCERCHRYNSCTKCIYNIESLNNNPVCLDYCNNINFQKYIIDNLKCFEENPDLYSTIMNEIIIT